MSNQYTFTYMCLGCGLVQTLQAPYRNNKEDIMQYLNNIIMPCIKRNHRERMPLCTHEHVDLKLPVPKGTESVGMKPKQE